MMPSAYATVIIKLLFIPDEYESYSNGMLTSTVKVLEGRKVFGMLRSENSASKKAKTHLLEERIL